MSMLSRITALTTEHPFFAAIVGIAVYVGFMRIRARRRNPRGLPLPPGPKGLPLVGSMFDMPVDQPWLVYDEWFKVYGDMVYIEVLGQPILLLGSLKRTGDLFDKRSSNYSDRFHMPMLVELMHWGWSFAMMPYGPKWRRYRRLFTEHFHPNTVWKYEASQQRESRAFLQQLLRSPGQFIHHIRQTIAASIIDITYGARIEDAATDPLVINNEKALAGLTEAATPGAFLVDVIPVLKYVPSWFPGAEFKRKAERWSEINTAVVQYPFIQVESEIKEGKAAPSIAASLIDCLPDKNDPRYAEERVIAQGVAAVTFVGATDMTGAAMEAFFAAMAQYPGAQKKAQEELDSVVGRNRLPDFNDRSSLPYVMALIKELMRWHLITPLGLGHTSTEDDEYDGYFIPKGTILIGNAWSILHDPTVFSNPLEFQPERYLLENDQLDPNARDPSCAAFGFGRRICPGRHMGENAIYSYVSSVLAVFDIKPILDDNGNPVDLKPGVTTGVVSLPIPFKCNIKPRDPSAEALIRDCVEY